MLGTKLREELLDRLSLAAFKLRIGLVDRGPDLFQLWVAFVLADQVVHISIHGHPLGRGLLANGAFQIWRDRDGHNNTIVLQTLAPPANSRNNTLSPMLKQIFVALTALTAFAKPVHLRVEHLDRPLGIDIPAPRFSWRADNKDRNWRQASYQIMVATNPDKLASPDVWDSGQVPSSESVGIAYKGAMLQSKKRYFWAVKTWDAAGVPAQSSEAWFETGLLNNLDWSDAQWIRWQNPEDGADRAEIQWIWAAGSDPFSVAPKTKAHFRTIFKLTRLPQNAAIFATAHGDYKIKVNGVPAGGKNAWMLFDRQEIGGLLKLGANVIEVDLTVQPKPQYGPGAGNPNSPREAGFAALVKLTHSDGSI